MVKLNDDQQLIREVVDRVQLPQRRLAGLWGGSFAAVHAWLNGMRSPTPESLATIADGLDRYAKTVREVADRVAQRAAEVR